MWIRPSCISFTSEGRYSQDKHFDPELLQEGSAMWPPDRRVIAAAELAPFTWSDIIPDGSTGVAVPWAARHLDPA